MSGEEPQSMKSVPSYLKNQRSEGLTQRVNNWDSAVQSGSWGFISIWLLGIFGILTKPTLNRLSAPVDTKILYVPRYPKPLEP